jgi:ribosomal protein S18 acetylase RimI-like enzyme
MDATIRSITPSDYDAVEAMVIDAFEPITWQKPLDARFGAPGGCDWRARWRNRLRKIFAIQIVLVAQADAKIVAMATATTDDCSRIGLIDVLCSAREAHGRGYGRQMLRAMIEHLRGMGMEYVQLDCLTTNEAGNGLYASEGFQEVARHIRWFR